MHQGLDVGEMVQALPSLPIGTCYLWSPQWLRRLERVEIGQKRTLDTSSTPKLGAKTPKPRKLAPVELDELKASMAELVEQAQANDPKALKKRVRELEAELEKARARPAVAERVEVPMLTDEEREQLSELRRQVEAAREELDGVSSSYEYIREELRELGQAVAARAPASPSPAPRRERAPARRATARSSTTPAPSSGNGEIRLKKGALEMLRAVAQFPDDGLTRGQIATLACISPKSGTFSSYLSNLRKAELIAEEGSALVITDEGLSYLGDDVPSAPASTEDLVELWGGRMKRGARAMLDELVACYPDTLTRSQLAEAIGMSQESGTFSSYLSNLRRNGLLEEPTRGEVRASETLFLGGSTG